MTGQIVHLDSDPHVAVLKLLPWHLTGRLDATEAAQVEAHLASCPECRAELETERHWQLMQPAQGAQVDVEDGWARMRARIADEPVHGPSPASTHARPRRDTRRGRFALPWRHADRPPSRAWAAPALLSVGLAAAIVVTLRPTAAPVPTAGDFHALAAPATDDATAVVRFRPDATEAQIRHSLEDSGARLVDGPTVTDAYVVRLPREHYAAALDKLRHAPAVALVEALESAAPR